MFMYLFVLAEVCALNSLATQQADLAFGHEQVEAVIRDRPDMGVVINREPALRAMLNWSFGGQFRSNRTYWDPQEPTTDQGAQNFQVYVWVTSKPRVSAVDKCAMLVFELHSRQLDTEWETLKNAALAGKINREVYAVGCVCIEFEALKKTQVYFANHPLKEAQSQENPRYHGIVGRNVDFSGYLEWLNGLDPKEYNPLRHYREMYDEFMAGPIDQVSSPSQRLPAKREISAEELLKE